MLSVSPAPVIRSSLEEMLENLRRMDNGDKPKDLPPPLPSRPRPTSKVRRPSAQRSLPKNFKVGNDATESSDRCSSEAREAKRSIYPRGNSFGTEIFKKAKSAEPPYVLSSMEDQRSAEEDDANVPNLIKKDLGTEIQQVAIEIQKRFRGQQDRRYFNELKIGVITLQSFIRGENRRREYYDLLIKSKQRGVYGTPDDKLLKAVIHLQSVIRGRIARRRFGHMKSMKNLSVDTNFGRTPTTSILEVKGIPEEYVELVSSAFEEIQRRVVEAEETIRHKEEENRELREQAQQFEERWLEHEAKIRSMEDIWQSQITSLQMSLAAAKAALAAGNNGGAGQNKRLADPPTPLYYDSDGNSSMGTQTPNGNTSLKVTNSVPELGTRQQNQGRTTFSHLIKEFEQKRQSFEEEAKAIIDAKSGRSPFSNPGEEFRRLKQRFEDWKKEYKVRLHETKAKLKKFGHLEVDKSFRRWWGKKSKRH